MELSKLSGYEKFIVMSDGARFSSSMKSYLEFKEVLQVLEECKKSDSKSFMWKDKIIEKPVDRYEADRLLNDFDNMKWNTGFAKLAHKLGLELR